MSFCRTQKSLHLSDIFRKRKGTDHEVFNVLIYSFLKFFFCFRSPCTKVLLILKAFIVILILLTKNYLLLNLARFLTHFSTREPLHEKGRFQNLLNPLLVHKKGSASNIFVGNYFSKGRSFRSNRGHKKWLVWNAPRSKLY